MNVIGYFLSLGVALYFVDAWFGIVGCLILISIVALAERRAI